MRTAYAFFLAFVVIAFVGCQTAQHQAAAQRDFTGLPATDFVVTVVCSSPEMTFSGTITTDGEEQAASGVGSATYHVSAHHLVCSFTKAGADGSLRLTVSEPTAGQASSTTSAGIRNRGARADVLRTPMAQHTLVTAF